MKRSVAFHPLVVQESTQYLQFFIFTFKVKVYNVGQCCLGFNLTDLANLLMWTSMPGASLETLDTSLDVLLNRVYLGLELASVCRKTTSNPKNHTHTITVLLPNMGELHQLVTDCIAKKYYWHSRIQWSKSLINEVNNEMKSRTFVAWRDPFIRDKNLPIHCKYKTSLGIRDLSRNGLERSLKS